MKAIYKDELPWEDKIYIREIFDDQNFDKVVNNAFQAQAVCFTKTGELVIFETKNGKTGLPGGHIEQGERPEETLEREIYEEVACKMLDFGPTCYFREYQKGKEQDFRYALRYWALVEPLDEEVNDPCDEGRKRRLIEKDELINTLKWGKSAEILLSLAEREMKKH